MKTFQEHLEESTYHAKEDESEIVHHLTSHKFDKFRPLSHFGSKGASREVMGQKEYDYDKDDNEVPIDRKKLQHHVVRIKLGKVAHIDDHGGEHNSPSDLSHTLHGHGHITPEQHKNHLELAKQGKLTNDHIAKTLRSNGIHTLAYKNEVEDRGSTSYMITHHSQVRHLRTPGKNAKVNFDRVK